MTGTPCDVPVPRKVNEKGMGQRGSGRNIEHRTSNAERRTKWRCRICSTFDVSLKNLLPNLFISVQIRSTTVTMLTVLRIKNLALVADLTLELQPGYNVITGETGAGKSIIIGALNLVLGERADRALIRSGSDNCSVEAVFDVSHLKGPLDSFLDENGLEH